ncbi:MAG: hypothetical protein IPH53_03370 [Flavobacteriales bacterium]|nr:hypothetical protein [Flavobacteriales bacterium]
MRHAHHTPPGIVLTACACTVAVAFGLSSKAQFTPGSVVISALTDPGASHGSSIELREYKPNGDAALVVTLPTTGPDRIFGATSSFSGALNTHPAANAVVITGYGDLAPAGTQLRTSDANTNPRVVGTVDHFGTFTRQATSNTLFTGKPIHAACTDGTHFWAVGDSGGVAYFGPGPQTMVAGTNAPLSNIRVVGGQLMASVLIESGPPFVDDGVYTVGTGLPTTAGATLSQVITSAGLNPLFAFNAAEDVCYVQSVAGVRKWVRNGNLWSLAYQFEQTIASLCHSMCVDFSAPQPVIYAVLAWPNYLVKWVDAGAPSPAVQLALLPFSAVGITIAPGPCAVGVPCDDGDPGTVNDQVRVDCTCSGDLVRLSVDVWLEGPYNTVAGTMIDALRGLASFPQSEPYTALGLPPTYGAGSTLGSGVLSITGVNAIVDWVLIELRAPSDPSVVVQRVPALLQRDGDAVALDGVSDLAVPATSGPYHVAVRHRNHLPVMSLQPILLSATTTPIDFKSLATETYGTSARKTVGTAQMLWAGDVSGNGQLKYAGSANDRDPILTAIGGSVPTATLSGQYRREDVNMNTQVRYAGGGNDRDILLQNIGGSVPTAVRNAQLP